jgi:hypothetical protein
MIAKDGYITTNSQIKCRICKMTSPNLSYSRTRRILLQPANDAANFWEPKFYQIDLKNAA